jgi:hypothetical protein
MDIVVWLRSLGLEEYEAAFRENEIDETVLPSLTEEHLKQLGVTALGHRLKLLDTIAALRSDAMGKAPSVDAGSTSPRGTFCFKPASVRMRPLAIGGGVIIGIAAYSSLDAEESNNLTELEPWLWPPTC